MRPRTAAWGPARQGATKGSRPKAACPWRVGDGGGSLNGRAAPGPGVLRWLRAMSLAEKQARQVVSRLVERLQIEEGMNAAELARRIGAVEGAAELCHILGLMPVDLLQRSVDLGSKIWKEVGGSIADDGRVIWRI